MQDAAAECLKCKPQRLCVNGLNKAKHLQMHSFSAPCVTYNNSAQKLHFTLSLLVINFWSYFVSEKQTLSKQQINTTRRLYRRHCLSNKLSKSRCIRSLNGDVTPQLLRSETTRFEENLQKNILQKQWPINSVKTLLGKIDKNLLHSPYTTKFEWPEPRLHLLISLQCIFLHLAANLSVEYVS